jgi:hypothetical protein
MLAALGNALVLPSSSGILAIDGHLVQLQIRRHCYFSFIQLIMQKRRLAGPAAAVALAVQAQAQFSSASSASASTFRTSGIGGFNNGLTPGRRLEDMEEQQQKEGSYNTDDGNAAYPYDLSTYSVRYEKCQNVLSWSDDLAGEEDATTVLALEHFVIFRLCPTDSCQTCYSDYGEYVLPVEEYLASAIEQSRQAFENSCEQCEEACNDGGYCDESCLDDCQIYENLGQNGYVDASQYIQCQQIDVVANDDDDDNADDAADDAEQQQLYIGPKCSAHGKRIYIGLFTDEDCSTKFEIPEDHTMAHYTGFRLWYGTLSATYDHSISSSTSSGCISCAEEEDNDGNGNGNNDADEVNEMCEELYDAAGKCESKHGISAGFIQANRGDGNYQNQAESEAKVCNFIDSLVLDSYTEKGQINLNVIQDMVIRQSTPLQKAMLTILTLSIMFILSYAVWLNRAINIAFPSVNDLLRCTD